MYNDKVYNNGENVDVLQEKGKCDELFTNQRMQNKRYRNTIGWKSSLKHFLMHSPILKLWKVLLLYFVGQGVELAAMKDFNECVPSHWLTFPQQPSL